MMISDIWEMICVLMNIRLGLIWALEMHLYGFL